MKVKEESEKAGLKLNIQKTKMMASGPITSWQIDGEIMETVEDFIFLGSKITIDGDFSHEIKRHLLLGRKAMTNPRQHIKKQRYHFAIYLKLTHYKLTVSQLEKTLESPLDCKEIQSVHLKENQS